MGAPPPDLRLLLPAAAVWVTSAAVPATGPGSLPLVLSSAGAAALAALWLLRPPPSPRAGTAPAPGAHPTGSAPPAGPPDGWPVVASPRTPSPVAERGLRRLAAALLLCAAAAATVTELHAADLSRGPIPRLAEAAGGGTGPETTVDLTITGDPVARRPRVHGSARGQGFLLVPGRVDGVGSGDGVGSADAADGADAVSLRAAGPSPRVRVRTPVTLIVPGRAATGWRGLLPSTRVSVRARVQPPEPGEPVAAVLLVRTAPTVLAPPDAAQRLAGHLRAGLREAAEPLPPDARALLPGLVVGDTSGLPQDLHDAFLATGLAHLTSVSGANLAILLGVLIGVPSRAGTAERGGLAARLGLPLRATAVLGAVLIAGFVVLCRPGPSVLRAAATALVGLFALATGRRRQALPALAGAVLVLLLVDPRLARSYGFLLSVLATAGLLTLGPRWSAALVRRGWPRRLAGALGAAAAAQALCGPALVLLSARVSLVAVPCNLLAEPAVAPATVLGFAALAVAPASAAAAGMLARLAAFPTGWLAAVARHGAALPGADLAWPGGWTGALILAAATAAAVAAAPLLAPGPRRRPLAAAALVLALLAVLLRPAPLTRVATGWPPPGWDLVACDVGQGDALVLPAGPGPAPDTAVVVDAGPDPRAIDGCLHDLGVTRVSLLVLTHFHADHVEGLPGVLRGRPTGAVETTVLDDPPGEEARVLTWAARRHLAVQRARPGEHRSVAGLSWDVLWPEGPLGADTPGPNNASVAMLVTVRGVRVAMLGDLEPPAQRRLLTELAARRVAGVGPARVDVLKVAHHGSAYQDWALTALLRPRLALISCGAGNPYGHPAPRTVAGLRALGATVLRTDTDGDIAVLGSPRDLHAAVHRPEGRP